MRGRKSERHSLFVEDLHMIEMPREFFLAVDKCVPVGKESIAGRPVLFCHSVEHVLFHLLEVAHYFFGHGVE